MSEMCKDDFGMKREKAIFAFNGMSAVSEQQIRKRNRSNLVKKKTLNRSFICCTDVRTTGLKLQTCDDQGANVEFKKRRLCSINRNLDPMVQE